LTRRTGSDRLVERGGESVPEYDDKKFKELILYVSEKLFADPKFGAVKLNKVLYFSDFLAFAKLGKPITGATYQKLEQGPAPKQLLPARRELEASDDAEWVDRAYLGGYTQIRVIPKREADITKFTADEIAIVDRVIDELRNRSAAEVSALSHEAVGWRIAQLGQEIPYESAFLSDEPLSEVDIERGQELAEQHGWTADQP
jgi:uncharacterized phage-associated protein